MRVAKTFLKHVLGGNENDAPPQEERFTRFEQTARSVPGPSDRVISISTGEPIENTVRSAQHCRRDPVEKQSDINTMGPDATAELAKYRRFEPQHRRAELPADVVARPVAPSAEQYSNEGTGDIPLSVLHRALPTRFGHKMPPPEADHDPDDEFVFHSTDARV